MAKKVSRKSLIEKLDKVFSIYIRRKDAVNDIAQCVTCGKEDNWKSLQCGHFMSRKHLSTRWNEDNCQVQCAGCNVFRYGEQYKFSLYLGNNLSEELHILSKQIRKFTDVELQDMIAHYTELNKSFL
jgi:5-methylcytosine-specific restriction endonuclease McrA